MTGKEGNAMTGKDGSQAADGVDVTMKMKSK